jgi:hypothetical protein
MAGQEMEIFAGHATSVKGDSGVLEQWGSIH